MRSMLSDLADERWRRRDARIRQLERERQEREEALFARLPRLRDIKQQQAEIGLALARGALKLPGRPPLRPEELAARGQALARERATLLAQHGVDPRVLEVHWDCPDCQNTGWRKAAVAPGQDSIQPPEKCHCLLQEEVEDLYRFSGLTRPLQDQSFDRFDLTVYPAEHRTHMAMVRDECRQFAEAVAAGHCLDNLLLMGGTGLGKTFLATAAANAVLQARRVAVYVTFPQLLDLLRRQRFSDEQDGEPASRRLLESDLLILDDLGAEKISEFVGQELLAVLNQRLNQQRPVIISTNLELEEIRDFYQERIFSRILGHFSVLLLVGTDVRRVLKDRRLAAGG